MLNYLPEAEVRKVTGFVHTHNCFNSFSRFTYYLGLQIIPQKISKENFGSTKNFWFLQVTCPS